MTYTSGIADNGLPSNDASISSAGAGPASARTEALTRGQTPRSSAIDDIASDSAKVSLAGAMLSQAATGSDVRFDKVAELRQSIDAGTYNVSSANVAGKLIDALQK